MEVSTIELSQQVTAAHEAVIVAALGVPGSKIVDGTGLQIVSSRLFETLAQGTGNTPRLAIVLQFDAWAMYGALAVHLAEQLRGRTQVGYFHARQHSAGHVERWARDGTEAEQELALTLDDLERQWRGGPTALMTVEAAAKLARAAEPYERGTSLAKLSYIAYRHTDPATAGAIAREALEALGDTDADADDTTARVRAMRTLGLCLDDEGARVPAVSLLEEAVELAEGSLGVAIRMRALLDLGTVILNHHDWPRAEAILRRAADLTPDDRDIAAIVHHNLATALLFQRNFVHAEAAAIAAYKLRTNPQSRFAQQDLELRDQARNRVVPKL